MGGVGPRSRGMRREKSRSRGMRVDKVYPPKAGCIQNLARRRRKFLGFIMYFAGFPIKKWVPDC